MTGYTITTTEDREKETKTSNPNDTYNETKPESDFSTVTHDDYNRRPREGKAWGDKEHDISNPNSLAATPNP